MTYILLPLRGVRGRAKAHRFQLAVTGAVMSGTLTLVSLIIMVVAR